MRKPPIILKDKQELIDEIEKLNLQVEYYKGKCEGYESLLIKCIDNKTRFQIIDLKENKKTWI